MAFTLMITGSNRGLGLELCRQYAADGWQVIATCRKPETATRLKELATRYPNISIHRLDVTDFAAIDELANQLRDQPIDLLINNAGIFGPEPGQSFGAMRYQDWDHVFRVNVEAPARICEAFLPNIMAGRKKLIVAMSSLLGSIAENTGGGYIQYRSTKAALNSVMVSMALALKEQGVGVLIMHPGWVRTDMGGPNAPLDATDSITGVRRAIGDFSLTASGRFVNYRGEILPW